MASLLSLDNHWAEARSSSKGSVCISENFLLQLPDLYEPFIMEICNLAANLLTSLFNVMICPQENQYYY